MTKKTKRLVYFKDGHTEDILSYYGFTNEGTAGTKYYTFFTTLSGAYIERITHTTTTYFANDNSFFTIPGVDRCFGKIVSDPVTERKSLVGIDYIEKIELF